MHQHCDLEYYQNNGVIAVRPTETGFLSSLVKKTKRHDLPDEHAGDYGGRQRVWVFRDATVYEDKDGDERINHHQVGVRNGTYHEGQMFLQMCRELGFFVENQGFFVPFSNGESREGTRTSDIEPLTDWDEGELKLLRWDLPTRVQLIAFISLKKTGPRGGTGSFPGVEQ